MIAERIGAPAPSGLAKAVAAAKARAEERAEAKKAEAERQRRVVATALGVVLNAIPRMDLIGQDLGIAPGIFGQVTTRGEVRIVRRCHCGQELRGIYISNPTSNTLADLGDLLQNTDACTMCGSGDEIATALAAVDEDIEEVLRRLHLAIGEERAAWAYHVGMSVQVLDKRLAELREVGK